jgi:hypothetical protein
MLQISDNLESGILEAGLLVAIDCSGSRVLSGFGGIADFGSISGTSRSWSGTETVEQTGERTVGHNVWQAQMSQFAVDTRDREKLAPMAATTHAKVAAMKPHAGPAAGKQDPGD